MQVSNNEYTIAEPAAVMTDTRVIVGQIEPLKRTELGGYRTLTQHSIEPRQRAQERALLRRVSVRSMPNPEIRHHRLSSAATAPSGERATTAARDPRRSPAPPPATGR